MFLISQPFLALATRRRCGAGRPGGSGGRAARDPTYGEPPGRCQRSSDFNACLVLLFENSYWNPMKINAFLLFFHAPRGPTYGRPPGRCKRTYDLRVVLCFGIASVRLLHGKHMKTLILFKPAHVLQRFSFFRRWFSMIWMLFKCFLNACIENL